VQELHTNNLIYIIIPGSDIEHVIQRSPFSTLVFNARSHNPGSSPG